MGSHQPRVGRSGWIWCGLLVFVLCILIYEGWLHLPMAPFQPVVESYLVAAKDSASLGYGQEPYIQGKLIPVHTVKRAVDRITLQDFPHDMLAKNPAEVGTVVLVTWH